MELEVADRCLNGHKMVYVILERYSNEYLPSCGGVTFDELVLSCRTSTFGGFRNTDKI